MLLRWMRRLATGLALLVLLVVSGVLAIIAFNSPVGPPRLAAGDTIPGLADWNKAEVPEVRRVAMRDGAPLTENGTESNSA